MHRFILPAGLVLLAVLSADAQETVLTFNDALERARQSSPAIVAARMKIEEARGRVIGAALSFPGNPTVEVEAGRRSGQASTTDYGVEVAQDFDQPQRRRARMSAADAAVMQEEQRARETERELLREVAEAFFSAVEARERADVATIGKQLAGEALRIAERRYALGDVAQLDVNLARTAVARSEAESRTAAATLGGQLVRLQVLLGMSDTVTIDGSLRETSTLATADLVARAADRPDVQLLDAEIAEAEADLRLARTLRWPDFGLRGSYRHEEGDRIFLGGVGFSLPVFHRGQESTAIANARLARLRTERDALTQSIDATLRGAIASYGARIAADAEYQRIVLPLVDENERLALESYEVGQIGLGDLLLVRREALDARRAFIDQLIETRLAEVDLRAQSGVWK
ncbi:MAG: TolC family protein [Acidobacteriota bacterium]|nr:TolC family protein [Acidobacteriota bacterium]